MKTNEIHFCIRDRGEFGFLSNFDLSPFKANGVIWNTVEHFFQAMKTTVPEEREHIRNQPTPKAARKAGMEVYLRRDWEDIKLKVMRWALERKFKDLNLRNKLLATGNAILIEDSPWDGYWGIGNDGNGKNVLGILLMQLRFDIRKKEREKNIVEGFKREMARASNQRTALKEKSRKCAVNGCSGSIAYYGLCQNHLDEENELQNQQQG